MAATIDPALAVTVFVNLMGLVAIYTGLKVQIAVLVVKVTHIQDQLIELRKK